MATQTKIQEMSDVEIIETAIAMRDAELNLGIKPKTITIRGIMGSGKTTIPQRIADRLGLKLVVVSLPTQALGDTGNPIVKEIDGIKVTTFAWNEYFQFHKGEAFVLCLDEKDKGMLEVRNQFLDPISKHQINGKDFPKGTIVICTSNLEGEGVGDVIYAHELDREIAIKMKDPSLNSLLEYNSELPVEQKYEPVLLAWSKENEGNVFENYRTNPNTVWGINPSTPTKKGLTMRGLHQVSDVLKIRDTLPSTNAFECLITGLIGMVAGTSLLDFLKHEDKLVPIDEIRKNPEKAKISTDTIGKLLTMFNVSQLIEDKESLATFSKYIGRYEEREFKHLFTKTLTRNKSLHKHLFSCKPYMEIVKECGKGAVGLGENVELV
jgi:hypothetical protein